MPHQADMTPCTALPCKPTDRLIAVGWLSIAESFNVGEIDRRVYDRLLELTSDPWQPFAAAGPHYCDLCQFVGEAASAADVFIPDGNRVFVCPALITHYINAHHYKPPAEFCAAVIACPPMRSSEYRAALVRTKALQLLK